MNSDRYSCRQVQSSDGWPKLLQVSAVTHSGSGAMSMSDRGFSVMSMSPD
eukprot:SAG22_NODE_18881_length_280_cov_0.861878_1_plen_49_part_10